MKSFQIYCLKGVQFVELIYYDLKQHSGVLRCPFVKRPEILEMDTCVL